jgi:hypothetical protein
MPSKSFDGCIQELRPARVDMEMAIPVICGVSLGYVIATTDWTAIAHLPWRQALCRSHFHVPKDFQRGQHAFFFPKRY